MSFLNALGLRSTYSALIPGADYVSDDNPTTRARRYRERAAECRELARLATSQETRGEYLHLAQCYDDIAEAELKLLTARET
jgi:hypothetical protein